MTRYDLVSAFESFCQYTFDYADEIGYDILVADGLADNSLEMSIRSKVDDLPEIYVDVQMLSKPERDTYKFDVSVAFPEVQLSESFKLAQVVDSWRDAIAFADSIKSSEFSPQEWI